VPKKRTPRQRRQAQDQARAEQRRLAQQEREREEHTRLVVERAGDPRFVQRVALPGGGAALTWDPDSADGQAMRQALEANQFAFREKFGRDPGPDDPVFFDPDADEPVPLTGKAWDDGLTAMAQAAAEAGVDPAYVAAWQEVGYIVTDANRHLFSAADVHAYLDAVARHQDDDEDDESTVIPTTGGIRPRRQPTGCARSSRRYSAPATPWPASDSSPRWKTPTTLGPPG
jgi:hypothetical protein